MTAGTVAALLALAGACAALEVRLTPQCAH
jgi:hypothetical protein